MDTKVNWEEFSEQMRSAISNDDDRHAIAEKIVKHISDSIEQRDLASMMLPKETIPVGTTAEYTLPDQLKAYFHEPGSYAPRTQMTQRIFTVPTWMVSAHPEYELSQLESGRYGTVQDQVKAAREAILGAINARVYNTMSGAITSADANYFTSTSGFTRTALNNALNRVEDQVGGAKVIIGRRNLLYQMLDFGTTGTHDTGVFSDRMKDVGLTAKSFPTYRGVPIVALPQWRDGFGKLTIPQDEILVVGEDVGRYVVAHELRSKDDIDIDTLIWHIHLYMKIGAAVFFPERMAKIVIT